MPQLDIKSYIVLISLRSFVIWRVLLIPSTIYTVSRTGTKFATKFEVKK